VEPVQAEVAVVGAGVVGSAVALALARRGIEVALLEAESEPGLAASGTNSGILHTGFDSAPGELETEMILRSAQLRDPVLEALKVPVLRCGALMRPGDDAEHEAAAALAENAQRNGVEANLREDGSLEVPGEAVTDPVAHTLALGVAAHGHGARFRASFRVARIEQVEDGLLVRADDGESIRCRAAVNCGGLFADDVARLVGDESFEIYPRKGEFLVFDPGDDWLEQILLPVPSKGTKGVLVFPTLDGKVVAGPTAVDLEDKGDWSVRMPEAAEEIVPKAKAIYPALDETTPLVSYAGLRPAGRSVNYVIRRSEACECLVHAAAIRSTGLTASLGIAERVCELVAEIGLELGEEAPLDPVDPPPLGPWYLRSAGYWNPN
jgi:glycerol-3-phosphate dehydrogenase